jgi:hypothetical protein
MKRKRVNVWVVKDDMNEDTLVVFTRKPSRKDMRNHFCSDPEDAEMDEFIAELTIEKVMLEDNRR